MRFTKPKLLALLLLATPVHGNEAEGGGAGGEGEGKAAVTPRDQREYTEKTTKLNALAAKIEEANKRFAELTRPREGGEAESGGEGKGGGSGRAARRTELVEISKQRAKDQAEYVRLKTELAQRYPNRGERGHPGGAHEGGEHGAPEHEPTEAAAKKHSSGAHAETSGEAKEAKAHEKAEPAHGIDAALRESQSLMERVYAPFLEPKPAARSPAAEKGSAPVPRLRLER